MTRIAFAAVLFGTLMTPAALAAPAPAKPGVFDAPVSVDSLTIPGKNGMPYTVITCSIYAHFTVKQVDEGEVGAAQLSFIAGDPAHKPKCQKANAKGEKVIDPKDWSGYFKGVKGDYAVFDADDGVNGGMGFAVFTLDAKKLFEDTAFGEFHSAALDGTTLTMRYQRNAAADCSVLKAGASCWTKTAATFGLPASPQADCAAGYLKAKNEMAKGRCEADKTPTPACTAKALKELDAQKWDEAPSVIIFEAQTVIANGHATTTAMGPALSCHPSD